MHEIYVDVVDYVDSRLEFGAQTPVTRHTHFGSDGKRSIKPLVVLLKKKKKRDTRKHFVFEKGKGETK